MNEEVKRLFELARDKSQDARRHLLENITDLFLSQDGRLNEHERALMSDILSKLVESVETEIRQQLSETLVKTGIEMPDILKLLASDDIEIARPVLEKSKLLQDADLIEVVRMRTDEHRLCIALRQGVSEELSESLIEYGSHDVIEALIRNSDAILSRRAMEYLVTESRRVDRFQEPLLNRNDLPSELAYQMYWWVSAALRKKIVTEFEVDQTAFDQALQTATRQALVEQGDGDGAFIRAQKLVRRMAEMGELTVKFLIQALRQQRIPVFVAGIGEMGQIDFRTSWRIFSDRRGESLAVLSKAIGIERNDFTSIFLLLAQTRDGSRAQPTSVLKPILELYDSVTPDNAKGALLYWQSDASYQIAIDELGNVQ